MNARSNPPYDIWSILIFSSLLMCPRKEKRMTDANILVRLLIMGIRIDEAITLESLGLWFP